MDSIGLTPFKAKFIANDVCGEDLDAVTSEKDLMDMGVGIVVKARMFKGKLDKIKTDNGGMVTF